MGESLHQIYQKFLQCNSVSIDTRTLKENAMFFALKGPNFDGNEFAEKAVDKGALYAMVDEEKYALNDHCILVENVLKTFQDLAQLHRQKLNVPVLAITGSNGKTTTKELINAVLSKKFITYATKGNLNNHIGVPLTLLSIGKDAGGVGKIPPSSVLPLGGLKGGLELRGAGFVIIEMGANHIGEIARLCEIAMPDFGLITNIGKAHLEGFGGLEGVAKAKSELYYYLLQHDGKVFVNSKNVHLIRMASRFSDPIKYGTQEDFYHCELIAHGVQRYAPCAMRHAPKLTFKAENGDIVKTNLAGAYNLENIEAALCIGKYFKVNEKDANRAVAEYTPQSNRSEIIKKGTNIIISDAYNANPQSMEVSIKDFANLKVENKILILGDMFELGKERIAEHEKLGKLISKLVNSEGSPSFKILLCGEAMKYANSQLKDALYFKDKKSLSDWLVKNKIHNSYILVKASRGMEFESIIELM